MEPADETCQWPGAGRVRYRARRALYTRAPEPKHMKGEVGDSYEAYRREVRALVPFPR